MQYDLIIAGVGAMGSATAYFASAKGWKVLGIDRYHPPHTRGSSHGKTRMIREAYYEDPAYVPLLKRAYELWQELGKKAGADLLRITGGLMIGPEDGELIRGVRESCEQYELKCRQLSSAELLGKYPAFRIPDSAVAIWEPRAGILFPELAVDFLIRQARQEGAEFSLEDPVIRWEPVPGGYQVYTKGAVYRTRRLLLAAGPWLPQLMPADSFHLQVERQVQFWFGPKETPWEFMAARFPVFLWQQADGDFFYGFPDLGDGVKLARHHGGQEVDPDLLSRVVDEQEILSMRSWAEQFIPAANGRLKGSSVCMYTNTSDRHFRFGQYPGMPGLWIASICSGHGFKFSPVMGEVLTRLMGGDSVEFGLDLFRLGFPSGSEPAPDF